jgi:hypothetical protein
MFGCSSFGASGTSMRTFVIMWRIFVGGLIGGRRRANAGRPVRTNRDQVGDPPTLGIL